VAAGIRIAVGTDAGLVDHANVWKELREMQTIGGISNEEALYIGTLATARSIGVDHLTGSIESGKAADFLIVAENPLEDLAALADPVMVVADGVIALRQATPPPDY
jgi:imidazolonepropionase-like amidohydrolase